jgi:hypothetical protein
MMEIRKDALWLNYHIGMPNNSKVLHDFEIIAEMMGQDSIAISSDSMECLAFGITAKKNMKFEREYFKGEEAIRKVYRFGN